ncbi:MAG: hypothetical protein AB7K09_18845 [Planctomycetota bacterium]
MQQNCQVCGKPVTYERGVHEVACAFCYTEYRVDAGGRLKQLDVFDDGAPDDAAGSNLERADLERLMDDGADQHMTFVKDTDEARKPKAKPAPKAVPQRAPSNSPATDVRSLEFADDDSDDRRPAASGPTFRELTARGVDAAGRKAQKQKLEAATPKERDQRPVEQRRKRKKKLAAGDRTGHPPPLALPEDMPQADDSQQKALIGLVVVVVGVLLVAGLGTAAGIILSSGGSAPVNTTSSAGEGDDEPDMPPGNPTNDPAVDGNAAGTNDNSPLPVAADGTVGLDDLLTRATELMGMSHADAAEAVARLEAATTSSQLNGGQRSRVDNALSQARQACEAWRLLEQGEAALARADNTDDALHAGLERHFARQLLQQASGAARRSDAVADLRKRIADASERAKQQQ